MLSTWAESLCGTLFTWTANVRTTILLELFFLLPSHSPSSSHPLRNVAPSKPRDLPGQGNVPPVQGRVVEDFACRVVHREAKGWDGVGGG